MSRLLQLNLLVLLWSFTGILGELLTLEPASLVFWRTAYASGLFYLYCRFFQPNSLRIRRKDLLMSLGTGLILGIHWICFFGAIAVSNVSVGLAGFAATSLFTALLEPLFAKRRPDTRQLLLAILVAVGIILIAGAKTDVPNPLLGLSIAIVGALLAAIYSIFSKQISDNGVSGPTMMFYQISASCFAAGLAILVVPHFEFQVPVESDWPALAVLSVACTFLAYLWFARLLKHLTAYTINLAINFEPVYGFLMAAVFFSEYRSLTPLFYTGALTIVAANILHARQPN